MLASVCRIDSPYATIFSKIRSIGPAHNILEASRLCGTGTEMGFLPAFDCFWMATLSADGNYGLRIVSTSLVSRAIAVGCAVLALAMTPLAAQTTPPRPAAALPDAPSAVLAAATAPSFPGEPPASGSEPLAFGQQPVYRPRHRSRGPGLPEAIANMRPIPGAGPALYASCPKDACSVAQSVMCCEGLPSPFARFLKSPDAVPLSARTNLQSAINGVIDPFNLLTIGGDAAISVASDSHSPYGPGFDGFVRYAGVSLTEDMTGEFFGTFLFPSMFHQDPHFHRVPYLPVGRRILHAFTQVVWAQSYDGRPMFNYGNILGGVATAAVSNTFVPGPGRQGVSATAQRLAIAFAISPSSNLIAEFLPDVSRHINLRIVIFQRILNTVTEEESGTR